MPYTTNSRLPKVRACAVRMVRSGKSMRTVARYFGFNPSTISKWCKRAPKCDCHKIPTKSSRPKSHPRKLSKDIAKKIIKIRIATGGRCSEVVHQLLLNQGIKVSLNSVKRTLDRQGLLRKRSPQKRYHAPKKRPTTVSPGDLVQLDTIHLMPDLKHRIYVYTLLDVYSRWAYAWATDKINTHKSLNFLKQAQGNSNFAFKYLQSDHGSEFSQIFSERAKIEHRHSRVRKPNDNAHLERFNRTIQQELIDKLPKNVKVINRYLKPYLKYYNNQRLHLGINLKTPNQILSECCQAIG